MSFNEEGFLSHEIENYRENIKNKNIGILNIAYEINKIALKMRYEYDIPIDNAKLIAIGGLYVKIMKSFQSSIILYELGLESDAKAISRVFMENAMKLCAICNDSDYCNSFCIQDSKDTLKKIRSLHKGKFKDYHGEDFIEEIKSIDVDGLEESLKEYKAYYIEEIAGIANMMDIYVLAYKLFCSNVHSDITAVKNLLKIDKDNNIYEFKILPEYEGFEMLLGTNINILLRVLYKLNELFNLSYLKNIKNIETMLNDLFEKFQSE